MDRDIRISEPKFNSSFRHFSDKAYEQNDTLDVRLQLKIEFIDKDGCEDGVRVCVWFNNFLEQNHSYKIHVNFNYEFFDDYEIEDLIKAEIDKYLCFFTKDQMRENFLLEEEKEFIKNSKHYETSIEFLKKAIQKNKEKRDRVFDLVEKKDLK
jgi:hypothetical protein